MHLHSFSFYMCHSQIGFCFVFLLKRKSVFLGEMSDENEPINLLVGTVHAIKPRSFAVKEPVHSCLFLWVPSLLHLSLMRWQDVILTQKSEPIKVICFPLCIIKQYDQCVLFLDKYYFNLYPHFQQRRCFMTGEALHGGGLLIHLMNLLRA